MIGPGGKTLLQVNLRREGDRMEALQSRRDITSPSSLVFLHQTTNDTIG